jgi:hypothetical protein
MQNMWLISGNTQFAPYNDRTQMMTTNWCLWKHITHIILEVSYSTYITKSGRHCMWVLHICSNYCINITVSICSLCTSTTNAVDVCCQKFVDMFATAGTTTEWTDEELKFFRLNHLVTEGQCPMITVGFIVHCINYFFYGHIWLQSMYGPRPWPLYFS